MDHNHSAKPGPAQIYQELRHQAFGVTAESLGVHSGDDQILGVIIESGIAGTVVTLVALVDGTISMYLPTGPIIIGSGEWPEARKAGANAIECGRHFAPEMRLVSDFNHPTEGSICFFVLGTEGVRSHMDTVEHLVDPFNPYNPFFLAANQLLTEVRLATERKRKS